MDNVINKTQLGLQLYTVRSLTSADMLGTLRKVAEIGFGAVEFAGFANTPVSAIRATLDQLGLRASGAHVQYNAFASDVKQVCEDLVALGCEYAIVPAVPENMRTDPSTTRGLTARLEQWGATCQEAGLRFAYHNHAFEFDALDSTGSTLWDALLSTNPRLVDLELDVFWAEFAGKDSLSLIRTHADRIRLLHLKDIAVDQNPSDVPVGRGRLNWEAVLAEGKAAGVRWFVVEQDNPRDPLDDITQSARYLDRYIAAV